jgi:hypothetical protein
MDNGRRRFSVVVSAIERVLQLATTMAGCSSCCIGMGRSDNGRQGFSVVVSVVVSVIERVLHLAMTMAGCSSCCNDVL